MGGKSHSSSELPPFPLTGLPGQETSQNWMFLLLGILYIVSIVGNALILFIIKDVQSLHQPMYYFLSLLSVNDLDLIRLPCGDITINNIFGQFIVISNFGLDSALILLSYMLILRSVLTITSREGRLKTLDTCGSHMCAVLMFYVPMVGVSMAAHYERHAPQYMHVLMSLIYLFVLPMLNPVIYTIKTKEIRQRLCKILLGTNYSGTLMGNFGTNISSTTSFTLTGFPEMEGLQHWLATLFLLLYAISILGNILILFIIKEEQSLQQPMYYFLYLLSVNDLGRLPFCKANVLNHSYCLHPDLIHLPCGDTTINSMYGLFIVISAFGVDSVLILLSYVLIQRSVLVIASQEERLKILNTCVSHICAVLIFYVPMVSVSMVHQFGKHAPEYVHKFMSLVYLFVPPMLNPIIYSIKTKEI
ncbi:hypothetical protein GH733_001488, partial [Mirounga leonina]